MAHKREVEEIDGYYVSCSLPKAFFMPSSSVCFRPRDNVREQKRKGSQRKESKRRGFEIRPYTVGNNYKECMPVEGRQHLSIQTDLYLEEICDVVEEVDAQTETDPLLDRPPSPLFIPSKYGQDVATQIYPGELFDFDEKVEPLLEVFVGHTLEQAVIEIMSEEEAKRNAELKELEEGKRNILEEKLFDFDEKVEPLLEVLVEQTVEQAVIEVMAEEELAMLSDSQISLETKRNAELEELKQLEEEGRRILEEKQRQLKEKEEAITLEDEVAQKIAASIFSQNYLSKLVPQVYEKLEAEGYFEAEEQELYEVEENFWPWLLNEVDSEIATLEASSHLLDNLIQDSIYDIAETSSIKPTIQNVFPDEPKTVSDKDQDTSKSIKLDENEEASNIEKF